MNSTGGGGGGGFGRNNYQSSLASLIRMANMPRDLTDLLANSFDNSELGELINNSILNTTLNTQFTTLPVTKGVLGEVTFIKEHVRPVKSIDFSTNDDHIFASVGLDGKCNIFDARLSKLISSTVITFQGNTQLTGVKFISGGNRLALTTSTNKLLIFDVEKCSIMQTIDKCVLAGMNIRCPIAVDPNNSNYIMIPNYIGRGLSHLDLRSSTVAMNMEEIHDAQINDIQILDRPWSREFGVLNNQPVILTASSDNTCKITDLQKHPLKKIECRSHVISAVNTPEIPNTNSCITLGGDRLSVYPSNGNDPIPIFSANLPNSKFVTKLRYTKSGNRLFCSTNDGNMRMYKRDNLSYELSGIVYKHSKDIQDFSISRNDEFIVTASSDLNIGIIRIGEPLCGPSEYGEYN